MQVPVQIPNLVNIYWIVYIKDNAFATLYDVYLRNFDVNDRQRKEYSVLWFRQIWRTLNDLAGRNHPLTVALEDIENAYNPLMPPYGNIQFEAKVIYSRSDGKYYYILIIDNFNYTLPYFDNYGGKKVIIESKQHNTMNNTKKRIRLTESQLHRLIKEAINELDWKTYANAARKRYKNGDYDKARELMDYAVKCFRDNYRFEIGDSNDYLIGDRNHGKYPDYDNKRYTVFNAGPDHGDTKYPYITSETFQGIPDGSGDIKKVKGIWRHCPEFNTPSQERLMNYGGGFDDDLEKARQIGDKELDDYYYGNYEYEKGGRGWHLKDDLDESICRAIRKALR